MEASGGITPHFAVHLGYLARRSKGKGSRDATKYGSSRTSPTNFYIHHVQRISVAAVSYDAKAIRKAVCGRKQQLLSGRTAGAGL